MVKRAVGGICTNLKSTQKMGYANCDIEEKKRLISHMIEASVQRKRFGFLIRQSELRTRFAPLSTLNLAATTHKEKSMAGCAFFLSSI